jgi:hypothetical protein
VDKTDQTFRETLTTSEHPYGDIFFHLTFNLKRHHGILLGIRLASTILHACMLLFYQSVSADLTTKLREFNPQANYTDRATAVCRRNLCQHFRECCVVSARYRFSKPRALLFHSNSSSVVFTRLSGPSSSPLLLRKSGGAGNRTWSIWICSQEL